MENFDLMAETFDTDFRSERAKAIADIIRSHIVDGLEKSAMEFGCGTGLVGVQLINDLDTILFVDSSPKMIEQLEKKLSGLNHSKCSALCCDFTADAPPDLKVDYIFTSLVLHHIADTRAILTQLFQLLNDGGHLLIVDLDKDDGSFHAKHSHFGGHDGFEQTKLMEIAENAGFTDIKSNTFYHDTKFINDRGSPYSLFIMDAKKA